MAQEKKEKRDEDASGRPWENVSVETVDGLNLSFNRLKGFGLLYLRATVGHPDIQDDESESGIAVLLDFLIEDLERAIQKVTGHGPEEDTEE